MRVAARPWLAEQLLPPGALVPRRWSTSATRLDLGQEVHALAPPRLVHAVVEKGLEVSLGRGERTACQVDAPAEEEPVLERAQGEPGFEVRERSIEIAEVQLGRTTVDERKRRCFSGEELVRGGDEIGVALEV